jgi:hypothetical protein
MCAVFVAVPAAAQMGFVDGPRTISVQGEATVKVAPDKALVTFGIETSDDDVDVAKNQNTAILDRAVAAITRLGVDKKQIQTEVLSIRPSWKYDDRRTLEDFQGNIVRNQFTVTVTDVDKLEKVVSAALETGVNYLHDVDFLTDDLKTHRERARELALLAAREKAEKMTAVLGESVGRVRSIQETWYGNPWYWSSWSNWGSRRGARQSQVMVQASSPGGGIGDTMALGQLSISARVKVAFELTEAEDGTSD